MKLRNAEWKEVTILCFTVEESNGPAPKDIFVYFLLLSKSVSCSACQKYLNTSCEHIEFLQQIFNTSPAWQISDFIADCTGSRRTPEFIGTMQRAFDIAVGKRKPYIPDGWKEVVLGTENISTYTTKEARLDPAVVEKAKKMLTEKKKAKPAKPRTRFTDLEL
jgi:hypothetical protein